MSSSLSSCSVATSLSHESSTQLGVRDWPRATSSSASSASASVAPGAAGSSAMPRRYPSTGAATNATLSIAFPAMPIPELLTNLLTAAGPSGHETAAAKAWRDGCAGFAAEVGSDHLGSSFARVPGTAGGPKLAIVGHIDEIGLHVTHIDDQGYLHFGEVGGWDSVVLIGQRMRIDTQAGPVTGVIGRKAIHL